MFMRSYQSCVLAGVLVLASLASPAAAQPTAPPASDVPATSMQLAGSTAPRLPLSARDSLVALARAQIGKPYRFGGRSPKRGFDCSGFVQYILAALRLDLPRTAAQQAAVGRAVARDTTDLRPGDLLTFGDGRRITHIGIYVGNGRFVHASSRAGRVVESSILRRRAPAERWRGVRRLALRDPAAPPAVAFLGAYGAVALPGGDSQ